MTEILEYMKATALQAGEYIRSVRPTAEEIGTKEGRGNFVTLHDRYVQDLVYGALFERFPEIALVGEEDELHAGECPERCFIIDPIDGTANFINGYGHSAVSIAFAANGKTKCGVVYDPFLREMFWAEEGKGAYLNESSIWISGKNLKDSIVLFGASPYDLGYAERTFRILNKLYAAATDLRNSGSAALDICYVASGKADIFFELLLYPWDHAAAGLILKEAGGVIRTCEGTEPSMTGRCSIAACSPDTWEKIRNLLI